MKYVMIELAIIALVLCAIAAYAGEPDGSKPMSPDHRAQIDRQGHLPRWANNFCSGHVSEVIKQPTGALLLVCRSAKLKK